MLPNILDTIDFRELGLELQAARKRAGMRQEDAAKIIDVARTTLTAIEKGERKITAPELMKLAQAYRCQLTDLVRPRTIVNPSTEQFRGPWEFNDQDQEVIEPLIAQLIEHARNYMELEELLHSPMRQQYPVPYSSVGKLDDVAEHIAMAERHRLGLGDSPLPDLRDFLEEYVGLRIFYLELPKKFSEIYLYDERFGGCLAVNKNHPEERRRWSMAHGYLHFLAHRQYTDVSTIGNDFDKTDREQLAEAFTAHFLMPSGGLKRRVIEIRQEKKRITPADLLTLAHLYSVSVEALTLRLESLSLLPSGTWNNLKDRGFSVEKMRTQLGLERIKNYDETFPTRYKALAFEAYEAGILSEGRFAQALGYDRNDARFFGLVQEDDLSGDYVVEESSL